MTEFRGIVTEQVAFTPLANSRRIYLIMMQNTAIVHFTKFYECCDLTEKVYLVNSYCLLYLGNFKIFSYPLNMEMACLNSCILIKCTCLVFMEISRKKKKVFMQFLHHFSSSSMNMKVAKDSLTLTYIFLSIYILKM